MSRTNNYSKNAFEFSLTAELQKRLNPYGPMVVSEKNNMYFRNALAYGRLLPWQEADYDNAASVVADVITKKASNIFRAHSGKYVFSHPVVRLAEGHTDMRDIVITSDDGDNMGIVIGSNPEARLDMPFLFNTKRNDHFIIDIAKEWYGKTGLSDKYTYQLETVQQRLKQLYGKRWNEAFTDDETKFQELYYPLLDAVIEETEKQCTDRNAVAFFIKKLFGKNDYYLVSLYSQAKKASIVPYDINGNLGLGKDYTEELLPTQLIRVGYKERINSIANSIISLTFDRGWTVNIRLKQEGAAVKMSGPRLEVFFSGDIPHNALQEEVRWK